jgi:hypothetical protein
MCILVILKVPTNQQYILNMIKIKALILKIHFIKKNIKASLGIIIGAMIFFSDPSFFNSIGFLF